MDYRFKTKPFKHQLKALEKSWSKEAWAWFMEMGTGKTKVCIDNIAMLYDRGKINSALVIAPNGIKRNWRKELSVHMPDHVEYMDAVWVASPKKQEQIELMNVCQMSDKLQILIMNIEALSTGRGVDFARSFLLPGSTVMVIDESTTIKIMQQEEQKTL